jgi:flagellar biosynthesis protein FlhF
MRIKKFVAPTLKEATEEMKRDLGPEAIILNTRNVAKGGVLNFLGKETIEITAAVDDAGRLDRAKAHTTNLQKNAVKSSYNNHRAWNAGDEHSGTLESIRNVAAHFEQKYQQEGPQPAVSSHVIQMGEFSQLKSEVEDIKSALRQIAEHMKYSRMPSLPDSLTEAYIHLISQEVDEEVAADLVQSVYSKLTEEQLYKREVTDKYLLASLAALFKTSEAARTKKKRTRVIALVGPTGVGKTTTIAKLAAINKLMNHLDVALISADTYRIGAIEQLRTFAAIADIPIEVAYKPGEMGSALKKFSEKDIIFVDTVGRSQKAAKELAELRKFVDAAEPDEVHLVLNASTNAKTQHDIIDRYVSIKPNRILFSKLDEAAMLGPILNVMRKHQLPISYVTTGQVVPDDIVKPTSAQLASMLYRGAMANA